MNCFNISQTIDYLGGNGIILTPEQKSKMQTSLTLLKSDMNFPKINFWGKIMGTMNDYFICQGIGSTNEMIEKTTIYSRDCMSWGIMPEATQENIELNNVPIGQFTGDPVNVFETLTPSEEDSILNNEGAPITLKEEDRLAATVAGIDHDVSIVPRGAFIQQNDGNVISNRFFQGLSSAECSRLSSYYHFREAEKLPYKPIRYLAALDKAIDYLDPIEDDIPRGSWSIQFDQGTALVHVKSFLWPGFVFFTVPEKAPFGSLYFGTGIKNIDLPFML